MVRDSFSFFYFRFVVAVYFLHVVWTGHCLGGPGKNLRLLVVGKVLSRVASEIIGGGAKNLNFKGVYELHTEFLLVERKEVNIRQKVKSEFRHDPEAGNAD